MWAPEMSKAANRTTQKFKIELWQTLWDKNEKIRDKEQMTIDYINRNLYINWKSVQDLNATVKKISENLYSVEFEHEFLEWPKTINMVFETKYENNWIFMNFQGYKISTEKWMRDFPTNNFFEIDKTTHNKYDVRTVWNWKRENFNIVYNDYKTKEAIKNIVKSQKIITKKEFNYIPEFENTQLTKLNNPVLWKEVYSDEDGYYRTLFYSTGNKKVDITNIYFKPNWEFNVEKTLQEQEDLEIMWVKVKYNISTKWEYSLDEWSKKELEEKVRHDREVLINMLNNTEVADNEVFSGLDRIERNGKYQFDSKIISLDPISWIYGINLNKDNKLEQLWCTVDWDNVKLPHDKVYLNYYANSKDKKATNYYRITTWNEKLDIVKVRQQIDNPKEMLPNYSWDNKAVRLLTWNVLVNYKQNCLEYTDSEWSLIAKIPCHKLEDWNYEVNEEYSTKIDIMDLYNYSWFNTTKQSIENLTAELWIVDANTIEIFKKCLQNEWVELEQKLVKITDPNTWESIYYKLDGSFGIEKDEALYKIVKKCLNLMKTRLGLLKKINDSHVWRKNGKTYKDFEWFVWWEAGVWKEIVSDEQVNKFVSWEVNEVTVKISRWKWYYIDIVYSVSGDELRTRLKSWEWKWSVFISNQRYTIKTKDKSGDIVVDPKEERE